MDEINKEKDEGYHERHRKVAEIFRLQAEALAKVEQAKELLLCADKLSESLGVTLGLDKAFTCGDQAYQFRYRAIGFLRGIATGWNWNPTSR